jgi:two-component system cell cycle sensor histidine kinase/response regulator CckA
MMFRRNVARVSPSVLVVDDEPPIRSVARRILEADGYSVVEASDGLEAVGLLSQEGASFDLVVADLEMPKLGGDEMVCRIRWSHPDLKVLYVTGFIDKLMDSRQLWEGEAFLDKPFTTVGLREAVSLLLFGTIHRNSAL